MQTGPEKKKLYLVYKYIIYDTLYKKSYAGTLNDGGSGERRGDNGGGEASTKDDGREGKEWRME